jgi:hypothetical protein
MNVGEREEREIKTERSFWDRNGMDRGKAIKT